MKPISITAHAYPQRVNRHQVQPTAGPAMPAKLVKSTNLQRSGVG